MIAGQRKNVYFRLNGDWRNTTKIAYFRKHWVGGRETQKKSVYFEKNWMGGQWPRKKCAYFGKKWVSVFIAITDF